MRISDAPSAAGDNPPGNPPGWFREGSAPRSMSAIRINIIEEATASSSVSREDLVRNVSSLRGSIIPAPAPLVSSVWRASRGGGGEEARRRASRGNRMHAFPLPSRPPGPPLPPRAFVGGRRLSISSFLPQFGRRLLLLISLRASALRARRRRIWDSTSRDPRGALSRLRDKRLSSCARRGEKRAAEATKEAARFVTHSRRIAVKRSMS